jgi:aminoglycoside phosphotransferase (APT) family kinase protein
MAETRDIAALRSEHERLAARDPVPGVIEAIHARPGQAEARLTELLAEALPGLPAEGGISVLKSGGENVVLEVGGRFIVKLLNNGTPGAAAAEIMLQRRLSEAMPDMVPRVTHVSETHQAFAMEKRAGIPLRDAAGWRRSKDMAPEAAARLKEDLRRFMERTAELVSPEEAEAMGMPVVLRCGDANEGVIRSFTAALGQAGFPEDRRGIAAGLAARFRELVEPCLIHGDCNAGNLLIDPKTGTVTAVLDFAWARIGPRFSAEEFFEDLRYRDGGWHVAHSGPDGSQCLSGLDLVTAAEDVARRYRQENLIPRTEWLDEMKRRLRGEARTEFLWSRDLLRPAPRKTAGAPATDAPAKPKPRA